MRTDSSLVDIICFIERKMISCDTTFFSLHHIFRNPIMIFEDYQLWDAQTQESYACLRSHLALCLHEYQSGHIASNPGSTLRLRAIDELLEYRPPHTDARLIYHVENGVLYPALENGETYWRVSFEAGRNAIDPAVEKMSDSLKPTFTTRTEVEPVRIPKSQSNYFAPFQDPL
jgi:hypothetical protein